MKLIVITSPEFLPGETELMQAMLEEGLDRIHLRKPGCTAAELAALIERFPAPFRPRITLHDHFPLQRTYGSTASRNRGTAPPFRPLRCAKRLPRELSTKRCWLSEVYRKRICRRCAITVSEAPPSSATSGHASARRPTPQRYSATSDTCCKPPADPLPVLFPRHPNLHPGCPARTHLPTPTARPSAPDAPSPNTKRFPDMQTATVQHDRRPHCQRREQSASRPERRRQKSPAPHTARPVFHPFPPFRSPHHTKKRSRPPFQAGGKYADAAGHHFFRRAIISSATFLPDMSIPPNIGPMRGVPETAEAAMPHT